VEVISLNKGHHGVCVFFNIYNLLSGLLSRNLSQISYYKIKELQMCFEKNLRLYCFSLLKNQIKVQT
jgi:hypothetical protein